MQMEQRNLSHVICLQTRESKDDVANVVAAGCRGTVYFFTLLKGGQLVAWFSTVSSHA